MKENILKHFVFYLFVFSIYSVSGQNLNISGNIKDSLTKEPISLVSVVLYKNNQIISYTTSTDIGIFTLKTPISLGIYTLKTNHLGYQPIEKQIIIIEKSNISINVKFLLTPKVNRLDEIIIKKAPPIIIKKDTIIYDVKHWTQKTDQTLEEVLSKIKGFKILPNGEIKVNGKLIRKVLVDGKEISNAGASVLTKSLDPNDIEKLEVRLNEQDNKIKESLLDANEYVVLDIKFKKEVNTSFFGKIRATTGYQNKTQLGGYANLFSINKKSNFHLFSEHDDFGYQTISLGKIRNIGKEAFQKNFELPADFQSLTERKGYQSEIYGFNDYILSNKNVLGLTSRIDISKKWTLFIGSYNSLNNTTHGKNIEQTFENISQNFEELKNLKLPTSKNKIELRYNSSKTKLRFDTNFIYKNSTSNTASNFFELNRAYNFNSQKNTSSFYNNLFFEQKINAKLGLEFKASHSKIKSNNPIILQHNNPSYYLLEKNGFSLFNFTQKINSNTNQFNTQITAQYLSKLGVFKIGNLFENRIFSYQSTSVLDIFSQEETNYSFQNIKPFLHHIMDFGGFSFSNKVGFSFLKYDALTETKQQSTNLDYYTMVNFSIYGVVNDITISYNNKLSSYPLYKLTKANTLINFQTQESQAVSIIPKRESVINFSLYKKFDKLKLDLDVNFLIGNSNNLNKFTSLNTAFLTSQKAQLKSAYQAFSVYFTKRLKALPITFILEPEALFNSSENNVEGIDYQLKTKRYLIGFKVNTNFKKRWYNFNLYPKYTRFQFENTFTNEVSNQDMFSFSLNTNLKLIKDKLFVDLRIRRVDFFKGVTTQYTNANVSFSGNIKKIRWFLLFSNISDDRKFVQKNIFPNYFVSQSNDVFGRFVKFGIEYKFK